MLRLVLSDRGKFEKNSGLERNKLKKELFDILCISKVYSKLTIVALRRLFRADLAEKIIASTGVSFSTTEAVESASLSLESVDDVEGSDGLSAGVFGVGDGVPDNVLEEASEDGSCLFVDVAADALDTTSAGESADSGLGDSHDGGAHRLLLSLGSVLSSLGLSVSSDLCFSWHVIELIIKNSRKSV